MNDNEVIEVKEYLLKKTNLLMMKEKSEFQDEQLLLMKPSEFLSRDLKHGMHKWTINEKKSN